MTCLGPAAGGKLICGFKSTGVGLIEFEVIDGKKKIKVSIFENSNPIVNPKEMRFNDGKVLSDGNFVLGSMNLGSLE